MDRRTGKPHQGWTRRDCAYQKLDFGKIGRVREPWRGESLEFSVHDCFARRGVTFSGVEDRCRSPKFRTQRISGQKSTNPSIRSLQTWRMWLVLTAVLANQLPHEIAGHPQAAALKNGVNTGRESTSDALVTMVKATDSGCRTWTEFTANCRAEEISQVVDFLAVQHFV